MLLALVWAISILGLAGGLLAIAGCSAITPAVVKDVENARDDSIKAAQAQHDAFVGAKAAGKTTDEATEEAFRTNVAVQTDARANAKPTVPLPTPGAPWWDYALKIAGAVGAAFGGWKGVNFLRNRQPYEGDNGEKMKEGEMVSTVAALKDKVLGSAPKPPA